MHTLYKVPTKHHKSKHIKYIGIGTQIIVL